MINNWSQDLFVKAWDFATLAHEGQTYGGPEAGQRIPYLNHIGSVAMEVVWAISMKQHYDGNLAIQCALLHDVIEDTPHSHEDISAMFGQKIADGVLALSKNPKLPTKQEQMQDSLLRIRAQPKEIWMVKMADRITNLSAPPYYWENDKKIAYRAEARIIHDALHPANDDLAKRLQQKISGYAAYISDI